MSRNGKIEVRKGVPVPEPGSSGNHRKYPWEDMEVGDHFVFPEGISQPHASSLACSAAKRLDRKFVTRKTDEGVACWRVE